MNSKLARVLRAAALVAVFLAAVQVLTPISVRRAVMLSSAWAFEETSKEASDKARTNASKDESDERGSDENESRFPAAEAEKRADAEVETLNQAEEEAEYEAQGVDAETAEVPPTPVPAKAETPKDKPGFFGRLWRSLFKGSGTDSVKEGGEKPETEESQAGTPDALTPEGDTGTIVPDEFLSEEYRSASRVWEPPNFEDQQQALGWTPDVFEVPAGLRKRVDFWASIYSKYTTHQGLLHDSNHVEIVYEAIDFASIMKNADLTDFQKARAREKLVKMRRAEYEERLRRLAKVTSPDGLSDEDLRVWKLWEDFKDADKFNQAAKKGRVRFQLGQKDKFVLGIYYSGRYIREMERIFRDAGLPIELTRLPFVESSFNIFARSKVGASGVWQFMRRTAKPYMMVNADVDERNDPIEATRASARLLKSNYQLLSSWPLAVTGYNHGPYGVRGIVNKLGTRDISEIVNRYSSRTFGFASENFYACFLAALEVERQARKYFGEVKWSLPFEGTEIQLTRPMPYRDLLAFFEKDENLARLHNFHLQAKVRNGRSLVPRGTFIRVPMTMKTAALSYVQGSISLPDSSSGRADSEAMMTGSGSMAQKVMVLEEDRRPRMRSAESLAAARSMESGRNQDEKQGSSSKRYRVRRGDNLTRIARHFRVSVNELKKANDLESDSKLRRGQWLTIPE